MIVHGEFQQKNGGDPTDAWNQIRLGKITASGFKEFVCDDGTLRKGERPKSYLYEKLYERWTGRPKPKKPFFNLAMNNGIIVESKAALFAEMEYGISIQQVGFVSDDSERYGCSPDGLIGWVGLKEHEPTEYLTGLKASLSGIEIKCGNLDTHMGWIIEEWLPSEHISQVQGSMAITGCQTWHFLSYPLACYLDGFPPLHLIVERDEKFCTNLSESLDAFIKRYDAAFDVLCEKNGGLPKPHAPTPDQLRQLETEDNFDLIP
jgi:hypothetical protein